MDGIDDPVELYRSSLKCEFARNTDEFFDNLLQRSGVNEADNQAIVDEIREIQRNLKEASGNSRWVRFLRGALVAGSFVSFGSAFFFYSAPSGSSVFVKTVFFLFSGLALSVAIIYKLNPMIDSINERVDKLAEQCNGRISFAWRQMEPLNQLFAWSDFARLVRKTLPNCYFDQYFSDARLGQLCEIYGFDESYNQSRSTLFAHSGTLSGHPFVFSKSLEHWMGVKTYYGTLDINWTTVERDSQGNSKTVRHMETLRASVEKPYPEYAEEVNLIYGNTAAPGLSFSRDPSELSGAGDGVLDRWRRSRAERKLESRARQISDGTGFTVMANREFETLFSATDRDNEIQFRLLFTPFAQQSMVKLLNDNEVGYGDMFSFEKNGMINRVTANFFQNDDISAVPNSFHKFDLKESREHFSSYYNSLFKGLFFSIAPILIVSLYQQEKPPAEVNNLVDAFKSCFWEHEAVANVFGDDDFEHPDCVTRSILRTSATEAEDGARIIDVTAYGYCSEDRVDYVTRRGGDGNNHSVAVPWVNYILVRNSAQILICDRNASTSDDDTQWRSHFSSRGILPETAVMWRGLRAAKL